MSNLGRVARRGAFTVVGIYAVVSVVYTILAFGPQTADQFQGALLSNYLDWLVDVTTLDLGRSSLQDAPVTTALLDAVPHTLKYVVPAVVFAVVGGIAVGAYTALNRHGPVDRLSSGLAYLGFGIPDFVIGALLMLTFALHPLRRDVLHNDGMVQRVLWPAALLGTTMLAGQFRHARAQSMEYLGTDFVKLVRAKGASDWTVAKHVLRNAALPLLSLFFVDMLAILVVNVVVIESVFAIPGIGKLSFEAAWFRDVPLVLGTTMVFVVVGFAGNFLQDVAYGYLDPRVGGEE